VSMYLGVRVCGWVGWFMSPYWWLHEWVFDDVSM
jgi:hypothetical protein